MENRIGQSFAMIASAVFEVDTFNWSTMMHPSLLKGCG